MLTAGLKSPPLIRKKTQTLTAREDPKAEAMKRRFTVYGISPFTGIVEFAIWTAVKPIKRKEKVPQNSPTKAMISFRSQFGTKDNRSSRPSVCPSWLDICFMNEDIGNDGFLDSLSKRGLLYM
jgi:hypothetical protein